MIVNTFVMSMTSHGSSTLNVSGLMNSVTVHVPASTAFPSTGWTSEIAFARSVAGAPVVVDGSAVDDAARVSSIGDVTTVAAEASV
jgi:hypothetical protein